ARPPRPSVLLWWGVAQVVAVGLLMLNSRATERRASVFFCTLLACLGSLFAASRLIGPFVTVPGLTTIAVALFMFLGKRRWQIPVVLLGLLSLIAPVALEQLG